MIVFDEASDARTRTVEVPIANTAASASDADEDASQQQSAREEVEAWLDAVALCFGLPEKGRRGRWLDFERL